MRRRLPAVFLAALLTFAVSGCGDDGDDSDAPTDDTSTSQSDDAATDDSADGTTDTEPTETDDADDQSDDTSDDGEGEPDDGESDDNDDNGAIPDDLESGEPDDPDDLPISAQVVLDTCDGVDPKDTWPDVGSVTFDDEGRSVVATAEVAMKGGPKATVMCAIAGSEKSPQVKAYSVM